MVKVGRFSFFSFPSPSILMPPRGTKRKRTKSKTCCTNGSQPNFFLLCILLAQSEISHHTTISPWPIFPFFSFTPPRGTGRNIPTHHSIGPWPIFPFFSFTPPGGRGQNFPTHRSIGTQLIFPFLCHLVAQSRSHDTLLNQSPSNFFFFLHH